MTKSDRIKKVKQSSDLRALRELRITISNPQMDEDIKEEAVKKLKEILKRL